MRSGSRGATGATRSHEPILCSPYGDPEPQPALRWDVRFGDGEWIDVIEEASIERPGIDPSVPVPPCMGEGGTNLSVTGLQPAG